MSGLGPKIIQSIKEAIAGDLARVTIEGVTWVRKDELDNLRAEVAELRKALELSINWLEIAGAHEEHEAIHAHVWSARVLFNRAILAKHKEGK